MEIIEFPGREKIAEHECSEGGTVSCTKMERDMTEWDGAEWKAFFELFCVPAAEMVDIAPWDIFADFMHDILQGPIDKWRGSETGEEKGEAKWKMKTDTLK